jgi:4-carboxymuconolactone decarboxylase
VARLPYARLEDLPERARGLLARLPRPLNIFRMAAHAHTSLRPLISLGASILARHELSPKLRELAILRVAHVSDARYEWIQHEALALAVGVSAEQIAVVAAGAITGPEFTAEEVSVLAFADDVIANVRAGDATLTAVREHLSEREVVELVLAVGYYMMLARLMETSGVDLDEPVGQALLDSARPGGMHIDE